VEMGQRLMEAPSSIDPISRFGRNEHCIQSFIGNRHWSRRGYRMVEEGKNSRPVSHTLADLVQALKGATVEDLHKSWSFSASTLDLLTAGKSFNLVALTALTAKIALVDNLLLQKAAGTFPGLYQQNVTVRVPSWQQQLPSNFAGMFADDMVLGAFTTNLTGVLGDYAKTGALIEEGSFDFDFLNTCSGTCFATIPGFGFAINCTAAPSLPSVKITKGRAINNTNDWLSSTDFNISAYLPPLLSFTAEPDLADKNTTITDSKVSGIYLTVSWSNLTAADGNTNNTSSDTCILTQASQICELRPALLNYTVEIDMSGDLSSEIKSNGGNGIQLTNEFGTSNEFDPFKGGQLSGWNIAVADVFSHNETFDMNIRAFSQMIQQMFGGRVDLTYINSTGYMPWSAGTSGSAIGTWWAPYNSQDPKSCVMDIEDPTPYIMEQINHITFRSSVYAAQNAWQNWKNNQGNATINKFLANSSATLPFIASGNAMQFSATTQYSSGYWFMGAAVVTMFFCVMCVLPSYWGFWELGRKVTLGPLEIASAFQAPVLDHPHVASGGEVGILMKKVGTRQVRYGQVESSGRLAVAEPADVRQLTVAGARPHWPGRNSTRPSDIPQPL
jgi:hypothetical protein